MTQFELRLAETEPQPSLIEAAIPGSGQKIDVSNAAIVTIDDVLVARPAARDDGTGFSIAEAQFGGMRDLGVRGFYDRFEHADLS